MSRLAISLFAACLLIGRAPMKAQLQQTLERLGIDRQEQREIAQNGKEVALAPGRHGSGGMYFSGAANPQFNGGGCEMGGVWNSYCWEAKLGMAAYGLGSRDSWFVGPTAAVHLQLPTRLAPFAGFGVFAGASERNTDQFDYDGQPIKDYEGFATIFPEIGVNFWLTDSVRLTASASYHITTEGRGQDFWIVGGGIAVLFP